jgi:FkbM family methyltransferase
LTMNQVLSELTPPIITKSIKAVLVKTNLRQEPLETMPVFIDKSAGSYSQWQEDLLLDAMLSCKEKGFYVDIGANHPEIYSNTKRFYDRGWNGINVEPITSNFSLFEQLRPRDINLNVGVGSKAGEMEFYQSAKEGGVFSGFDKKSTLQFVKGAEITTKTVPVFRLEDILSTHMEERTPIDFLDVDVEGYELEVLIGNDWSRFRPHLILVELIGRGPEIVKFLEEKAYMYVFSNGGNGIFIDSNR